MGISAPLARAAVRVVGSASDWRPVARSWFARSWRWDSSRRVGLWFAAPFIAAWLDEPRLVWMLRLFALDLPLFALAQAHQQILVALGHFRTRALLPMVRWTVRLSLIVVCVEAGLSSYGAVLAIVGTSADRDHGGAALREAIILRRSNVPVRELFDYAVPLLLCRVVPARLRSCRRPALEVPRRSAARSGHVRSRAESHAGHGPLRARVLARAALDRDAGHARRRSRVCPEIARDSLRGVLFLIPLAAVLAASSREIVTLLFGDQYPLSAQAFQCLIFAGLANVVISVGSAILIGAGKPSWTLAIAAPLPIVAIAVHLFAIPRFGLFGAASVTAFCATGGALLTFAAIHRLWQVTPPAASLVRSVLFAAVGVAVAASWSTPGALVVVKLGALCAGFAGLLFVSDELKLSQVIRASATIE